MPSLTDASTSSRQDAQSSKCRNFFLESGIICYMQLRLAHTRMVWLKLVKRVGLFVCLGLLRVCLRLEFRVCAISFIYYCTVL